MTTTIGFLLPVTIIYAMMIALYKFFNKGISRRSWHQQGSRFLITALLSSLPFAFAATAPDAYFVMPTIIGLLWATVYPITYHLTYRKVSSDYDNYADIVAGAYCWGLFSTCQILVGELHTAATLLAIAEIAAAFLPVVQLVYFMLYGVCIDTNGMKAIQESHINEILEFLRSFSIIKTVGMVIAGIALCGWCIVFNTHHTAPFGLNSWQVAALIALLLFYIYYIFIAKHCIFKRTGFVLLWNTINDYDRRNMLYATGKAERLKGLEVAPVVPFGNKPHTVVMVIGESASRDYMSAFAPQPRETTPWLTEKKKDTEHFILFPNTYSCGMQTVPTLERALTERNQYNDKAFNDSCSIVDIATKLGYTTHWYSNQGHLGAADTPITLVAESCDTAKWTKQYVGKIQYDETLLEFLDEVDPKKNNLLVVHLKGSHFNFQNRYPADYPEAANTPEGNVVEQYRTSLHYSDHILNMIFDYAAEKLNMRTMLYFSDHATIPNKRRSPQFNGYGMVRIPMFVYCSDNFIAGHRERYDALKANSQRYFTNDLVYELMCGLMDIRGNRFDTSSSIAYKNYKYQKEDLRTNEGKSPLGD